ncbi:MAG: BrnT family toxin [Candidatus Competibacteraceae bacterium]|nr:BrnT family toxin [Candidatus Competibacteraceae bacterium]MCB1820314.1 BrnT family toxin [Candidatus Competibacteraceae bacterium]MCP5125421.1 BrnT family toxin [Gammaproteobacteria bacterium]
MESEANVTFEDRRFDYGEPRFITLGLLNGEVVVVVTTETDQEARIISMRKATNHEQTLYFRTVGR